jgi:hypothetical protein
MKKPGRLDRLGAISAVLGAMGIALLVAACGGDGATTTPDAGDARDLGTEASTLDADAEDAGAGDASEGDGGDGDAGAPDGGRADASLPDASLPDGGAADAGGRDLGPESPASYEACCDFEAGVLTTCGCVEADCGVEPYLGCRDGKCLRTVGAGTEPMCGAESAGFSWFTCCEAGRVTTCGCPDGAACRPAGYVACAAGTCVPRGETCPRSP